MAIQKGQQSDLKSGIFEKSKSMKLMPKHASKHPKTSQHIPESLVLVASSFGVTRDHYGSGQAVVGSGASKPTFEEQIGFVF